MSEALVLACGGRSAPGDAARARAKLGWRPEVSFDRLVEMMVEADMDRAAAL